MIKVSTLAQRLPRSSSLVETLAPADDGGDRTPRRFERLGERVELGLHRATRTGGQEIGQALCRGMGSVGRREGIVDEGVSVCRERLGERGVVLLFARMKTCVLEKQHITVAQRSDGRSRAFTHTIGRECNGLSQRAFQRPRHGFQAFPRVGLAFRAAEMSENHHLAALAGELADGWQDAFDAGCVGDLSVFHRHVEVEPQQNALSLRVKLVERAERGHVARGFLNGAARNSKRRGPPIGFGLNVPRERAGGLECRSEAQGASRRRR